MVKVKIEVTGEGGSGKSSIAAIIYKALEDQGLSVVLTDDDFAKQYYKILKRDGSLTLHLDTHIQIYSNKIKDAC